MALKEGGQCFYPDKGVIECVAAGNGTQRNCPSVQRLVSDHVLFTPANALDH